MWGTPAVDKFATVYKTHLPQFISPGPERRALAIDALPQDWQGRSMYMFPPFPMLNQVIQKLRTTQVSEVILIAPWWPSQSWFPHLLRLCVDHPHFFPYSRDLLSQQGYVSSGKSYHLHAWKLSCNIIKQQDFQKRLLDLPQLLEGPLQTKCMTTSDFASLTGPQDKELIHFFPQLLKQPLFCITFLILMACHLKLYRYTDLA